MNKKVLIIGGGIAGAAAALFLQRAGWETVIFEAGTGGVEAGGGMQLAPNGMRVLHELGIEKDVIESGSIASEMYFRNQKGKQLGRMNRNVQKEYGHPAVNITRAAFHKVLLRHLEEKKIEIQFEKKLVDAGTKPDGTVWAEFEDGTGAEGDFMIGADGIHSKTRRAVLPDSPDPDFTGLQWIAGWLPAGNVPEFDLQSRNLNMTFGRKGFFGYGIFNEEDPLLMWWVNITSDEPLSRVEMTGFSQQSVKQELLELCSGWHKPVETIIEQTTGLIRGNVHDIVSLPRWYSGRTVLIGDAAHAVSPNSGQGASLALEDAFYLAMLLDRCSDDFSLALSRFENDRRPRVEKIVEQGRRSGDGKREMSPFGAWFRDQMLKVIFPLFGERGNRWIYEYDVRKELNRNRL
ncbi:FAD-dependent oxidoreductase [Alteribacter natronophilus]|uniref:FAD-dependent oxidoreductase n=1 Tax=Alteribacter natronophilus TaxID=2583810 RepID=UPI00110D9EFA|nr:NAD(P)/FAD-dependent oxidoreductase [Alteribacter natronophilus]TMW71451.1 FAD-dependent monooxygenase [Alteribacter natronophilus]